MVSNEKKQFSDFFLAFTVELISNTEGFIFIIICHKKIDPKQSFWGPFYLLPPSFFFLTPFPPLFLKTKEIKVFCKKKNWDSTVIYK